MIKNLFYLFIFLPAYMLAASTDPEQILDRLIEATKINLNRQIALREQVRQYQQLQNLYVRNTNDKELLLKLIKLGHGLLEQIKACHLEHTFEPDFISELTLFSQTAIKRGLPKP